MATNQDDLAEAGRATLTSLNSAVLMICTVVGAALSVYADLFQGALPNAIGFIALAGWVFGLVLILYLAGRAKGASGTAARLRLGLQLACTNFGFAALVVALTAGATFTAWSRVKSEQGGVLSSLLSIARDTQTLAGAAATSAASADQKASQILDDSATIRRTVTRVDSPIQALAKLGFTTTDADACRAINAGNEDALQALALAGFKNLSIAQPLGAGASGLCLEGMLLDPAKAVPFDKVFRHLSISSAELTALYVSQSLGAGSQGFQDLPALARSLGLDGSLRVRILEIRATPLVFAVWGNNVAATEALLAQNVDPNQPAQVVLGIAKKVKFDSVGTHTLTDFVQVNLSPLSEAQRLKQASMTSILSAHGAKAKTATAKYRG